MPTTWHADASGHPALPFPLIRGAGPRTGSSRNQAGAVRAGAFDLRLSAFTCEHHVNKVSSNRILGTLLPVLLLAGCGTPPARDFGGRWKAVNRFQAATTEIPLNQPYTYYASPMDETLRTMLVRWATDTGITLIYRPPSDYTLFAPVAKVRTADLGQAARELSSIYAAQGISLTVAGGKLEVDHAKALGSEVTPRHPAESNAARPPASGTSGGAR